MDKNERMLKFLREHPEISKKLERHIAIEDEVGKTVTNPKQLAREKRRQEKEERSERIADLWMDGWTYREIGNVFSIAGERVRQLLIEHYGDKFKTKQVERELLEQARKEAKAKEIRWTCEYCKKKFAHPTKKKYCSRACFSDDKRLNEYPDWVNGRPIVKENFTEEEWREINRIKVREYYRRNKDKQRKYSAKQRKKHAERHRRYAARASERKRFGKALTPLPSIKNPYAVKE